MNHRIQKQLKSDWRSIILRGIKFILLLILAMVAISGQTFAQENIPPSIHQIEYERHRGQKPVYIFEPSIPVSSLQKRSLKPNREIFGYLPYWVSGRYIRWSHITTLAYFGLEFDSRGNIVNSHGWPATSLVNQAHANGVRVVVVAINFNPDDLHSLLTNRDRGDTFIANLITAVKNGNGDGVNIDFELPYASDRDSLTAFMTRLAERCRTEIPGSHVSIATPAVNWSNRFDYQGLANVCDALMIMAYGYWWNGSSTAGPVSPLTGSNYNVTRTVNEYLQQTGYAADRIILGLPYYGIEWQTTSDQVGAGTTSYGESRTYQTAVQNAQTYGRRWHDGYKNPWYAYFQNNSWHQCWYDDSLSLSYKYQLALAKQLAGIGIWALGYDGPRPELWGAIEDHFFAADSFPPGPPTHFSVLAVAAGRIDIRFHRAKNAAGYQLYSSIDGSNFVAEATFSDTNFIEITGKMSPVVYFKLRAQNSAGVSNFTEVLAASVSAQAAGIMVVNGFDRVSGTNNTFNFIRQHGQALQANGGLFSSCSNEAVAAGDISLQDFDMIDWILGEEGTATESFSAAEQGKVKTFLTSGKALFVSGSEIGYDLVAKGNRQDISFYHNYLKADYIADDARSYGFSGANGSFFSSLPAMSFDNGTHGGYDVDYPDGIKPSGGSQLGFVYRGVNYNAKGGAGIYYQGTFGQSSQPGKLVYLAFPFEMIVSPANRTALMGEILHFFGIASGVADHKTAVPEDYLIIHTFPNPVYLTRSTLLHITVQTNDLHHLVQISLYNSLGQLVKKVDARQILQFSDKLIVDVANLSSGVYFIRAFAGNLQSQKRIIILR